MASSAASVAALDTSAAQTRMRLALPVVLLFFSGAAGLVYQVLWIKQLSLVVGVEVHAVATGISAFFAGLALGGLLFGRWADRLSHPVRLYMFLELAVAGLGVAATFGLAQAPGPFARWEATAGALAWVLPFALVGLPALLMGGTLPVLVRAVAPSTSQLSQAGGWLYAANTAGAIAGTLLAAFVLLPHLGVTASALLAACLNVLAAIGAWLGRRRDGTLPAPQVGAVSKRSAKARLAVALYCIAGGVALGYEVVWSQSIVPFMSTRAFAFSLVLATYLFGLLLGSALYARRADRIADPWGLFGLLIAAAGLLALVQLAVLGRWLVVLQTQAEMLALHLFGTELAGMSARFVAAALCMVFIPTTLLGAAFPLALRLGVDERHVGRDVGTVVALNTLGGILGVLLTGFVLVPQLGLVRALGVLGIVAGLVGVLAAWQGRRSARAFTTAAVVATLGVAIATPADRLAQLLPGARNGQLAFYHEGKAGTVAVVTQGRQGQTFSRLYIQGVSNTGDAMPSLRYMRLQALLPLMIHSGEPHSALVIGFGTGITAGAMLRYPGLERPVVAELLPEVLQAAPLFKGNYGAQADPRVDIRLRDGRRELLRSSERYDVITLEPPPPSAAGVVNLYSRDFYQLAASRLQRQGLVAQWLPLPTQNDEDSRSLVRSFIDAFPHATLWTTEFHEMLLIGSLEPIELDLTRISQRLAQPSVAATLAEVGIASPAALLATWVTDRAGLEHYAGDAAAVTDDDPRIEYAPWVRPREITRVLPKLMALRSAPPVQGADPAFDRALQAQWSVLQRFYGLSLHAYNGNRQAWATQARALALSDGDNPYLRWFLGPGPGR